MLTLFQVLTLEGWNDILATAIQRLRLRVSGRLEAARRATIAPAIALSLPQPTAAAIYFVTFIMLGTMIMLNLFTGVIISSMEEAQDEQAEETREEHLKKKAS